MQVPRRDSELPRETNDGEGIARADAIVTRTAGLAIGVTAADCGPILFVDPNARVIMLSGFVEPLGLTEQNTGANAVIAKTSNEAAHLVRSVKRLVNRGARKPPASQNNPPSRARAATS